VLGRRARKAYPLTSWHHPAETFFDQTAFWFGSRDYYLKVMANTISAEPELLPRYATKLEFFRLVRCPYRKGMRLLRRGFFEPVAVVARQPVFAIDQESIKRAWAIVRNIP
jgi:hypothetical protein